MEHVSDEYAKQLAAQNERNTKEDIGKLYLQKERTDLLEENDALKKRIAELEQQVQGLQVDAGETGLFGCRLHKSR